MKKKPLIDFVFAARYYQRFKKPFCQHRRELSGNSINVCVSCFWFKGFFFSFVWAHFFPPPPFSSLYFSYSVTSKPSFFKPLPSSSVYFRTLDGKFMAAKLSLWLLLLQLFLLWGHICFGRCVYGHDTNWLFHVPLTKLLYHTIWWTCCHRALCNFHSATYTA